MLTTNENAGLAPGAESATQSTNAKKGITKKERITQAIKQPEGLNRFEAERIGDHCLNSTIAIIRAEYGNRLTQHWERVPSRFNPDGVRVLRYRLT